MLIPAAYADKYRREQARCHNYADPCLWGVSTVRTILDRKEYLGHTVLHKSVGMNFKLHQRRETSREEQYVFENTHEPIISQELWDSVQRIRKRAKRSSPWGSHYHRLSGYLYCADCGKRLTLQTHHKKDGSDDYSFRCGGYASKLGSCTTHSITANAVENLLLTTIRRIARLVMKDEKAFAEELQRHWAAKQQEKPQQEEAELRRLQKHYEELSTIIRGLYENFLAGLLPERQYKQLMKQYDDEQAEIEEKIEELESSLRESKEKAPDTDRFISLIRKFNEPDEISDTMLQELVDRIVVHEGQGEGVNRIQQVDVYFNYVGQVNIAYSEEEIAEMKAQEEQLAAEKLAQQRAKEKARREKRKAEKIAANGGEIVKKKVCLHCGAEFIPASNRQVFCSVECRRAAKLEEKEAKREEERGDHYYRQRRCVVCGNEFWPNSSGQSVCSEECRKKHHNEVTLAFYHRKQEKKQQEQETKKAIAV